MKNIIILIALAATTLLHAQNAHLMMDRAAEKLEAKDTVAALALYEQGIRLEPRNPEVYLARAQVYMDKADFRSAKSDLDKAVLIDNQNPRYYNRRAVFFNYIGQNGQTINDANKALELSDNNAEEKNLAWYLRGEAKKQMGNNESALEDYNLALANNPDSSTELGCLLSSAQALGGLKRHKEAIERLEKLVEKYPDFLIAYNNLGYQYIQDEQFKEAVAVYDKLIPEMEKQKETTMLQSGSLVISVDTELSAPYNNRGYAKLKLGENKAALKDINTALGINPQNSYAYRNRALVYLATKKKKEACQDFEKALQLGYTNDYGNDVQNLVKENCE